MNTLILVLALCSSLFAQDFTLNKDGKAIPNYVGELKILKGKAFKKANGRTSPIKIGDRFNKADTIITEDKSFVRILIVDDSVLNISANSELHFSEFKFIDKDEREMTLELIKGQVRSLVKNKAKENEINFKTPHAVMGIRGTEILMNQKTVGDLSVSEFSLVEGMAVVTDSEGQQLQLEQNEHIVVVKDTSKKGGGMQKDHLKEELIKALQQDDAFLPYLDLESLTPGSPLHTWLNKDKVVQEAATTEVVPEARATVQSPGLDENLKKLNDKLKKHNGR